MPNRRTLEDIAAHLDAIDRKLDRLEVALLVRDPGTSRSVDAYDGLRKTIVAASGERTAHLAQLAVMHRTLSQSPEPGAAALVPVVEDWLAQAGMALVDDPAHEELFEVVGGEGDLLDVRSPAYIDGSSDPVRIVMQGRAARTSATPTATGDDASGDDPQNDTTSTL